MSAKNEETKKETLLPVEIEKGIQAIDLCLYIQEDDCMIFSDMQLGMEEQYNKQGIFIPRFNFEEIKKRLKKIFQKKTSASHIILNGDIKHGFGKATNQEWREITQLIEILGEHTQKITLTKGNHDISLEPIAKFSKLKIEKEGTLLKNSNTYICHGHEIPKNKKYQKAKTIVIGHEHPAIELKEGATKQKYKCFLVGKFEEKKLIVLPSFNFANVGSDPREGTLSPFLQKTNLNEFNAWLVEDTVYNFGKIKNMK